MKDTIPQIHLCLRNVWVGYLWLYCFISRSKLFSLCSLEPVQHFMKQVDLMFYQNLIQVLVPDVLKPIPATLTQSIRNFAKSKHSFNHNSKKKNLLVLYRRDFLQWWFFKISLIIQNSILDLNYIKWRKFYEIYICSRTMTSSQQCFYNILLSYILRYQKNTFEIKE